MENIGTLRHRDQTGEGQYLDASMMDTLATLMFMEPLEEALEKGQPVRAGNDSRTSPTGLYRTQEADIIVTVAWLGQSTGLYKALEMPELLADERFGPGADRAQHLYELRGRIQERIGGLTCAEAVARLKECDVPVAPVRTLSQVVADEHFYRRGTLKPMRHGDLEQPVEAGSSSDIRSRFQAARCPTSPAHRPSANTMKRFSTGCSVLGRRRCGRSRRVGLSDPRTAGRGRLA